MLSWFFTSWLQGGNSSSRHYTCTHRWGERKGSNDRHVFPFIGKSNAFPETFQRTWVYTPMARLCLCQCPTLRRWESISSLCKGKRTREGKLKWILPSIFHGAKKTTLRKLWVPWKSLILSVNNMDWMKNPQALNSWVNDAEEKHISLISLTWNISKSYEMISKLSL